MPSARVKIPAFHAGQSEVQRSTAKRKIIVCGRRWGKTILAGVLAVLAMLEGKRVLYAAPTAEQTDAFWMGTGKGDGVTVYLALLIKAGLVIKNETRRTLVMPSTGGAIRCKTAFDANGLRGDHADLLILDEFSLMKPDTWGQVGAPMLADNNGDAIFIFTPKRKNHAFHLYARAVSDDSGRWQVWNASSHHNPHLSRPALQDLVVDMTDEDYQQEILAKFLENEGAVFHGIDGSLWDGRVADDSAEGGFRPIAPADVSGHRVVIGADWGKREDFTAFSVVDAETGRELELYRGRGQEYRLQRRRLAGLVEKWSASYILAEQNSMGDPILEELRADGLPVEGFETTASSKPPLIESMVLSVERAEVLWLDDTVGKAELESYERKVSKTGRSSYSAPDGVHDDTVIARALARKAAGTIGVGSPSDNPDAQRRARPAAAGIRSEEW